MEPRKTKRLLRVGEVLERSFGGTSLMRRVQEQKFLDSWDEIVGEIVARRTRPIRLKNRVLQVKVSNSVWMQQLQFMKGMIIEKLRHQMGRNSLDDLRFFIGEICPDEAGMKRRENGPQTQAAGLDGTQRERIAKELAGIRDPEMHDILFRIFAKGLGAKKNRGKR